LRQKAASTGFLLLWIDLRPKILKMAERLLHWNRPLAELLFGEVIARLD
jgi:hypothetical protein